MRQYADPPRLRIVKMRSPLRAPDVEVDVALPPESGDAMPRTQRSLQRTGTGEYVPGAFDDAFGESSIRSSELVLEKEDGRSEDTPITLHTPWQRQIPPPLPRS